MASVSVREFFARERGSHHYAFVFILVLVLIMCSIGLPPDNSAHSAVMLVLAAVTLYVAVWLSGPTDWTPRIIAGLVVACSLFALITWAIPGIDTEVTVATRLAILAIVAVLPFVIGAGGMRAMKSEGVTLGVVFGAVSIYLLIAVGFAVIYAIIGQLESAPFFTDGSASKFNQFPEFMYFSVITQTTVGYGDFVPATGGGRAFASAQALMGQLYLVSVVAVVVSNFGRGTERQRNMQHQRMKEMQDELTKLQSDATASKAARDDGDGAKDKSNEVKGKDDVGG